MMIINKINIFFNLLNKCKDISLLINKEKYNEAVNELKSLYNQTYKEFNAIYSNSLILNYLLF